MGRYLERYLAGEMVRVWDEIATLRPEALRPEDKREIHRICDETMSRVRMNIERLISGLTALGYEFGIYPDGERFSGFKAAITPPDKDLDRKLMILESRCGEIPWSLRAFWKQVGTVCLMGKHDEWPEYSDPLVVETIDESIDWMAEWQDHVKEVGASVAGPFRLVIAPDNYHKDNVSGGDWYGIELPCETIDAKLSEEPHRTTFVNYLRIALRARGFPGVQKIPKPLSNLDIVYTEF